MGTNRRCLLLLVNQDLVSPMDLPLPQRKGKKAHPEMLRNEVYLTRMIVIRACLYVSVCTCTHVYVCDACVRSRMRT